MKTEREMFEEWYKSVESQYHKALNNYDAEFDCYTNDYIQCRYFAWQASAQRDGYKLVPLEMHWHKADDLASAEWDKHKSLFCSDNRDMTAIQVEDFRLRWCKIKANKIMSEYKAIIGAAE